ncbi:hypothetical protein [Macrococcus capreoli]|uniref:hypothetical protein n=1 Tax=Macrococcus capreoli TaxID=2982690 RepID=UPI003EE78FA1
MDLKLLLSVVAAGIPGLFSYTILDKLNFVSYTEKQNYEKSLLVTSLSSFNVIASIIILLYFKIDLNLITSKNLISIILISLTVTMILSLIVYPMIFKLIKILLMKLEDRLNIQSNLKTLPRLIENAPEGINDIYVYIFDVKDKKYISSGAIGVYSKFDAEFSLLGQHDPKEYDEVLNIYNTHDYKYKDYYINLDKGFCMFIFYQLLASGE